MNVIFPSRFCRRPGSAEICGFKLTTALSLSGLLVVAGALWLGFLWGQGHGQVSDERTLEAVRSIFERQRSELAEAREKTERDMDALALRLGVMQAHILRLDALGERLIQVGKLEDGEFDFGNSPALGGSTEGAVAASNQNAPELIADLQRLARLIEDRELKLNLLEELIMHRDLQKEMHPAGRPIKRGWISSHYGKRIDPFTGKKAQHKGIDFAGKKGSDVIAVAAGVVTEVEARSGYGKLVEINHGNGFVTRYAHNKEVLVQPGDRVDQGQTIAKMGSSGRSTGPHVHFEVLRNGFSVNPIKYVRASR